MIGIPISEDCPFPASPSALPRTDTCRLFFILVLTRFILFGIVILISLGFAFAPASSRGGVRGGSGAGLVAYLIDLHRVDFVFGLMVEFVFEKEC